MATENILLADLPPMLEGIVASVLECRPNLRVVRGSVRNGVAAAAAESGARFVVTSGPNPSDLNGIDAGLAEAAGLSVLVLSRDGAWACLHALRFASRRLDDLSVDEVLRVVDSAIAAPTASRAG
jgi:hypothetical protein